MLADRTTLTQFLTEERRRHPGATGELNALVNDVALACKAIAQRVAYGALDDVLGAAGADQRAGRDAEEARRARQRASSCAPTSGAGMLAGMVSEEMEEPYADAGSLSEGRYLLVFDPLDGSSNIDVNVSVGSIFSILRAPDAGADADARRLPAAGHAAGLRRLRDLRPVDDAGADGRHAACTASRSIRELGEFILTHPDLRIPETTSEFAINASNSRFWEPAVQRYVDECLAGKTGPARQGLQHALDRLAGGRDAPHPDARRRLHVSARHQGSGASRVGCACSTKPTRSPSSSSRPAAARAPGASASSTSSPTICTSGSPFVFGAREEVERIERYHREHDDRRVRRAAVRHARPVPQHPPDGRVQTMSAKHPDHRRHRLVRRRHDLGHARPSSRSSAASSVKAAFVEGDSFHRYDRAEMKAKMAEASTQRRSQLQPLRPGGEPVRGARGAVPRLRRDRHAAGRAIPARRGGSRALQAGSRAPSRRGRTCRPTRTCCSTRGCTARS